MPPLARLYIKTALGYLIVALLVGVVMAGGSVLDHPVAVAALWMVYLHLFVVGWLTQLIFGVAYWLFPRHSRERPYGASWLVGTAYVALNVGLLLRAVAEPAVRWSPSTFWDWGVMASALAQWAGVVLFAVYIWTRVKIK